jgi:hypothetical protein
MKSRPISRVLSWTTIHLGCMSPCTSSDLPESDMRVTSKDSYLVLLQVGFTLPRRVTSRAVRSYRTFSPLPAADTLQQPELRQRTLLRRYAFCCTFRRLAPPRSYLAPYPSEPGLSSVPREGRRRLPGQLFICTAYCRFQPDSTGGCIILHLDS